MSDLAEALGLLPLPVSVRALEGSGPAAEACRMLWGNAASLEAVAAAWPELPRGEAPLPELTLCLGPAGTPPTAQRTGETPVLPASLEPPERAEGYVLRLEAPGATLVGRDSAGLFYAVQTLCQIFQAAPEPPALEVVDYPSHAWRGFQMDLGRQMEGMNTLYRYIDFLAARKYNQCHLYLENAFAFSAIPEAWADHALTPEQARELDAYCRARHMELIPSANFLAHNENLLRNPAYAHLSETREGSAWRKHMKVVCDLCFSLPETWEILESMVDELATTFSSPYLHAGLDESYALGSCSLCAPIREQYGEGEVYRRHTERLHELITARGKQMLMWADMVLMFPEILAGLPADIIMVDWYYGNIIERPRINYFNYRKLDSTRLLREAGFEVLLAPAGDPQNQFAMARYGQSREVLGSLVTQWGQSSYLTEEQTASLVYGAECAWATALTPLGDCLPRLSQNLYGSREPEFQILSGLQGSVYGEGAGPAAHLRYRRERRNFEQRLHWQMARTACDAALAHPAAQTEPVSHLLRRLSLSVNRSLVSLDKRILVNEAGLSARDFCAGHEAAREDLARYAGRMRDLAEQTEANAAELKQLWEEDRPEIEPRGRLHEHMTQEASKTAEWAEELARFAADPGPGKAPFAALRVVIEVMKLEANAQTMTVEASADGEKWEEIRVSGGVSVGGNDVGTAFDYAVAGEVPADTRFIRLSSNGVTHLGFRTVRLIDLVSERLPEALAETGGPVWFAEHLLADDARPCLLNEAEVLQSFQHPETLEKAWVTLSFPEGRIA